MRHRDFDAETTHVEPVVATSGFLTVRVTTWQDVPVVDELRQRNRDWLLPWTLNNFNATGGARSFTVLWNTVPVGEIILWNLDRRTPQSSPTLSYWIDQSYARRGIMTYAVREVLSHAHGRLDVDTVLVPVSENNEASIGLARKLGLRELGPRSLPGASRHLLFASER